jgi:predicted transposase/invertase (TIGR01784 family)
MFVTELKHIDWEESIREAGREEGRKKGIEEVVLEMLSECFSLEDIIKATKLSEDTIIDIIKQRNIVIWKYL